MTSLLIKISEQIIKRPRNVVRHLEELELQDLRIKPIGTSFLIAVETQGGKNRDPQHYVLLKRNGEYQIQAARAVRRVDLIDKGEVVCLWNAQDGARPPEDISIWKSENENAERTPKRRALCPSWFAECDSLVRKDLFAGETFDNKAGECSTAMKNDLFAGEPSGTHAASPVWHDWFVSSEAIKNDLFAGAPLDSPCLVPEKLNAATKDDVNSVLQFSCWAPLFPELLCLFPFGTKTDRHMPTGRS